MYRFLLSWRWLGAFVLALVVAAGCVLLGQWQWDRREERLARNALITSNYDRDPVPLTALLDEPGSPLPDGAEWTPVRVQGRYLADQTRLLRNRPVDGRPAYHVLVPLRSTEGMVLLVDRGWVPTGQTGEAPDDVPAPPSGQVTVVARLRPAEPASDRSAPPGQTQSITPATAGIEADGLVLHAYGVLADEAPAPTEAVLPLPRPQVDEGPHLSYALQWFVFALGALVAFVVVVRRSAADAPGGGRPAARGSTRPRRPTAEEEEDALVDAHLGARRSAQLSADRGSPAAHRQDGPHGPGTG